MTATVREIVSIDEEKCDGCGLCIPSCAEGAIALVDGKARLLSDALCDGLGACLGDCPQGAITIEKREAPDFDAAAAEEHVKRLAEDAASARVTSASGGLGELPVLGGSGCASGSPGGCPGSASRVMEREPAAESNGHEAPDAGVSQLRHWPVQLMLVPPQAPFLRHADLLICADCVPFAVPDFHSRYMAGKAVVVGCPKLDDLDHYASKLQAMFAASQPRSITVLRMEVPCCQGIAAAAQQAHSAVAANVPLEVHTIGIETGASLAVD
jgi:ferredoxin